MVNILLIGNGAREHVIAEAIMRSPQQPKLFSYMKSNNPGIAKLSEGVQIGKYDELDKIKTFAEANAVDFAFIGPEDPLSQGVVDALEEINIKSVGPKKELAKLETTKSFTRLLMKKYKIPGLPAFRVFESKDGLKEYTDSLGAFVVKKDGLAGGKGVLVQGDHFKTKGDGLKIALDMIEKGDAVVIEEKLEGEEFSLMSLTDGKSLFDFQPVQDHKRAFAGDKGPNTGGMGSYSTGKLLPFMTEKDLLDAHNITEKVLAALKKETGLDYKGVMYGGFMITRNGVKLIEYNARFGDPEAMNVLPILKNDFVAVCTAVIDGTLGKIKPEFSSESTVCKYAVPEGYPDNPVDGKKIFLGEVPKNVKVYYASVDKRKDGLYMSKSRAVAFVGIAPTIEEAEVIAEDGVCSAQGPIFHREDVGTKELIDKRVRHMEKIRE